MLLVLSALLASTVGVSTAAADGGGSSDAAKACQKGGWQNWTREDGSPFTNTGDCVSYAARGGTLTRAAQSQPPPTTKAQLDCEAAGSVFSTDPSTNHTPYSGGFLWSCNGTNLTSVFGPLYSDCSADGGNWLATADLVNYSCLHVAGL
jgi:hypothetical protein